MPPRARSEAEARASTGILSVYLRNAKHLLAADSNGYSVCAPIGSQTSAANRTTGFFLLMRVLFLSETCACRIRT